MLFEIEKNVTVVIKTFERVDCVKRLYKSIRKIYPNITIIIADDSATPLGELGDARIIALPYDQGVSKGRNAAIREVKTKYFVLADDDFLFTRKTDFATPYRILETTDFSLVGIELLYSGWKRRVYRGTYEKIGEKLVQLQRQPYAHYNGYPAYHYVLQCFMARTDVVKSSPWDENFQRAFEHDDFFLQLKEQNARITHVDTISIDHWPELPKGYKEIREDTHRDKELFFRKHSISKMQEVGRGFPYWQLKLDSLLKFLKIKKFTEKYILNYKLRQLGIWQA